MIRSSNLPATPRPRESFPAIARCPRPAEWPEADRLAWQRARQKGGPLDRAGPAAHLSPQTCNAREQNWGRFVSYLDVIGQLDPACSPAERLTFENIGGYFRSLKQRLSLNSARQAMVEFSMMAWALAPGGDWVWIRRHPEMPTMREARESKRQRKLFDPRLLMARAIGQCDAANEEPPDIGSAVRFLDGVIVMFTLFTALRHKNVTEMQIGQHLRREHGRMRLVFEETVKNREVIDLDLTGVLRNYMEVYLQQHRPILLQGQPDPGAVWISPWGERLGYSATYNRFRATTLRLIGQKLDMHSVRHALATTFQMEDPASLSLASAALAHRGKSTVIHTYAHVGSAPANRIWQNLLEKMRRN